MCGIAGIAGEIENIEYVLEKMSKAQSHRGPDNQSNWIALFTDAQIGLAHNRLKIVDLNDRSNQPFTDAETGLTVVLDGKIHNYKQLRNELSAHYRFITNGHAELLLKAYHRWGKACLKRLNGFFSFAVYDRTAQHLFLARDHFGTKPLYFTLYKHTFYFASEIKALFAAGIPREPSARQWANYFCYSDFGSPEQTFWEGICELPAGYALLYDGYSAQPEQWYEFTEAVTNIKIPDSEEEATENFYNLAVSSLRDSMQADVPVGLNLSGGFDSSLLLGLAQKEGGPGTYKTYSYYYKKKRDSEIPWTEELLSQANYPLEHIYLSAKMIQNEASRIVSIQDEPIDGFQTLAYARLFRTAHKRGTIVLCDGHGLDEVWGTPPAETDEPHSDPAASCCLDPEFASLAHPASYPHPFENDQDNIRYIQLFHTSLPQKLRFNDRASMAYSTELRMPFINHSLIEYAFAVPSQYRIKNGTDKRIPRLATQKLFNQRPRLAPPHKSAIPEQEWLTHDLNEWVSDSLQHIEHSHISGWFDFLKVKEVRTALQHGVPDGNHLLWKWVNLNMLLNNK